MPNAAVLFLYIKFFALHCKRDEKTIEMVQGGNKLKSKKPARVTKKQQNPKAAAPKVYKAKKGASNITLSKLNKVHSSVLTSNTEKLIASRVGHLELIKGSRRLLAKQGVTLDGKKKK